MSHTIYIVFDPTPVDVDNAVYTEHCIVQGLFNESPFQM